MKNFMVYASIWVYGILLYLFGWLAVSQLPWYGWLSLIMLVGLVLEIKIVTKLSLLSVDFWSQLISPVIFFISSAAFLLFLEGEILRRIFVTILAIVLVLYLYNFWLFYRRPEKYHAFMLENFSWYLLSTSFYLLATVLYGLVIFINFPFYLTIIIIAVFTALASYKLWWIEKLRWQNFLLPALLMQLIVIEVFVSLFTLPLSYYNLAFWGAGVWLIAQKMVIDMGKSSFYFRRLIRLSAVFILIGAVLTATARWF